MTLGAIAQEGRSEDRLLNIRLDSRDHMLLPACAACRMTSQSCMTSSSSSDSCSMSSSMTSSMTSSDSSDWFSSDDVRSRVVSTNHSPCIPHVTDVASQNRQSASAPNQRLNPCECQCHRQCRQCRCYRDRVTRSQTKTATDLSGSSLALLFRDGNLDDARQYLLENNSRHLQGHLTSHLDLEVQSDRDDGTPLHWAASRGDCDLVYLLLTLGAIVNSTTKWLATPLHSAADNGHMDCARLLLKWGARINAPTENGDTPCHLAAYRGHYDVTKCLLRHGADTYSVNCQGRDVMNEAIASRRNKITKLVQRYHQARTDHVHKDKQTDCDDYHGDVDVKVTQSHREDSVDGDIEEEEQPTGLYARWQRLAMTSYAG